MGLWTCEGFKKNKLITEYSGEILTRDQALTLAAAGKASHVRTLEHGGRAIKGITEPKAEEGGASFANDGRGTKENNAKFVIR